MKEVIPGTASTITGGDGSLPVPSHTGAPTYTPGPWSHHVDIGCKCGVISGAEHPVAKVTAGDWGDDYPSIRRIGGSIEARFEAFIDQITYGHVPQDVADANARLIAAAPELLEALKETWRVLRAAGLLNLSNGVQLGQTSWYVKISDAEALSDAAINRAEGRS